MSKSSQRGERSLGFAGLYPNSKVFVGGVTTPPTPSDQPILTEDDQDLLTEDDQQLLTE